MKIFIAKGTHGNCMCKNNILFTARLDVKIIYGEIHLSYRWINLEYLRDLEDGQNRSENSDIFGNILFDDAISHRKFRFISFALDIL